jgi:hypothetical protein
VFVVCKYITWAWLSLFDLRHEKEKQKFLEFWLKHIETELTDFYVQKLQDSFSESMPCTHFFTTFTHEFLFRFDTIIIFSRLPGHRLCNMIWIRKIKKVIGVCFCELHMVSLLRKINNVRFYNSKKNELGNENI